MSIDFDNIEAGDELDAWIAMEVMGWVRSEFAGFAAWRAASRETHPVMAWCPSINFADAFQALDKWRDGSKDRSWVITPMVVTLYAKTKPDVQYNSPVAKVDVTKNPLPLAICRALGKAIRGQNKPPTERKNQ